MNQTGRRIHTGRRTATWAVAAATLTLTLACKVERDLPAEPPSAPQLTAPHEKETHFGGLRQLTFGGENAEAYWSFDGEQLIYQAHEGPGCDQIYRIHLSAPNPQPQLVSTGKGATTCAYFLPGDEDVVYASTHLGGAECPPKPDHSKGYVWPLHPSYDIFRAKSDGSGLTQLTNTPGYDAEATVCPKDGSILFTSVRDGDLELYRMNADGSDVRRLTNTPGYDGGGFFNHDCTQIVWRASRPEGKDLEEYQALLSDHLVRPGKLELYVANADGSEPRQITYLGAAAFAPFFHPSGKRVLFSTNFADPQGREFDIWAVNTDGTALEQITHTPGFDGFPMFSPDGKQLAFASNRANAPGSHDTNVFVTEWSDGKIERAQETAADRVQRDIEWLSDPAREGRGVGTKGLVEAGAYVEQRFSDLGLQPFGRGYRHEIEVTVGVKVAEGTSFEVEGKSIAKDAMQPLAFSSDGSVAGGLVLAGYGIVSKEHGIDDYAGLNVKDRIVVVRRFVPESEKLSDATLQRRLGDLRQKAWLAREKGAKALVVVDAPVAAKDAPKDAAKEPQVPAEAAFPGLHRTAYGDAGIPVIIVKRDAFAATMKRLENRQWTTSKLAVKLDLEKQPVFNVVGMLPARPGSLPGVVVIGAHYDHIGYGGHSSLAPEATTPHVGADDNASGVAAMLEIARELKARGGVDKAVVFMAFTAEEMGLLGSSQLVQDPPAGFIIQDVIAMLNLDMVGRLRSNRLTVLGTKTAAEWESLLTPACVAARIDCDGAGSGFGPSDQSAFFAAGIPVLHFFTGAHADYHKPSDTIDGINAAGAGQIASLVAEVTTQVAARKERLSYEKVAPSEPDGDSRSFNASLGTMPDYAGPKDGSGVLLAGVRPGGAAEAAGMRRGDVLVRLGKHEIKSVHDLMFALNASRPNETVTAVVQRDGKDVPLQVTFQESTRRR